ncbi:transposase [Geobacter sp.]|uniref:REP-associated tyrosine transposase n=1 Tax=Geobacter sp. TaxID=46610 RepID=UPI00261ED1D2|nr:transposase [Geobacter sp.]
MARPLRIEYPGAYYHVTSRGNEQKDIFKSRKDREKFLSYLESATERYGAVIHAFCLMSNHYHLLLETPAGNLSQIMRHINGAYTTYFNVKRKRAGHLFQGRYKAILVEADEYAAELSRYIHLNPVRAGIVTQPEEYRWSSHRSFIGHGAMPSWLKTDFILGYFGKRASEARKKYRTFVEGLIGKEYESPLGGTIGSSLLGSPGFIEEIRTTHLQEKEEDRNVPALRQLAVRPSPEEIIAAVKAVMGHNEKQARQASIYLCHKYSGVRLRELAKMFEVGETAICEASRRFSRKIDKDEELKDKVHKAKSALIK